MDKFGWSYPPGLTRLPWEDVQVICDLCLGDPEISNVDSMCLCPECDICGGVGDPNCYGKGFDVNHGLQIRKEHLPIIETRKRILEEIQRQEYLADKQAAEWENCCPARS